MITIIVSTNRKGNECLVFGQQYQSIFQSKTKQTIKLLSLENLNPDFLHSGMYTVEGQAASIAKVQDEYILPAQKFVFIAPEYNGSFPGILKLFLDACSIRAYKENFSNKKAALVGIASGRAGNLRGMDHLNGILNHMGCIILPNKLPFSQIEPLLDANGKIQDENTQIIIENHVIEFLNF